MENDINTLIMKELIELRKSVDEVRTKDIPNMKIDLALLVNDSKFTSKLYSGIAITFSLAISAVISHFKR